MPQPENTTQAPAEKPRSGLLFGLWMKCKGCGELIYQNGLDETLQLCPHCGFYYPMTAWQRIEMLADQGTFHELWSDMQSVDILNFAGNGSYVSKLSESQGKTGLKEAVVCGACHLDGVPVALGVMDFRFQGASMGSVVGEKMTRLIEYATHSRRALILVTASGGARMQEGAVSLMQMAKTSAALQRLSETHVPYITVLTHPTTGGVTASFASLGDIILAEPGALIGFAGPRVIKETTGAELPKNFQRSEFLLEHGFIDRIVPRPELKATLSQILHAWNFK